MADLGTRPADPAAGQTGHFAHHVWLADAVVALNTQLADIAPSTPPTVHSEGLSGSSNISAVVTAVKELAAALDAAGIVTKVT